MATLTGMEINLHPGWFQITPGVDTREDAVATARTMIDEFGTWLDEEIAAGNTDLVALLPSTDDTLQALADDIEAMATHFAEMEMADTVGFVMMLPPWPDRLMASMAMCPRADITPEAFLAEGHAAVAEYFGDEATVHELGTAVPAGRLVGLHIVRPLPASTPSDPRKLDERVMACLCPPNCDDGLQIEFLARGFAVFDDITADLTAIMEQVTFHVDGTADSVEPRVPVPFVTQLDGDLA